jgi:lysozyme family protein
MSVRLEDIQTHLGVKADGKLGPTTLNAIAQALGIIVVTAKQDAFTQALPIILKHEGGYVNHPKDPGGRTNLGVTQRVWEAWVKRKVTEAEMRALTVEQVTPLYRKNYWDAVKGDEMHPAVALCVFDFAVNAGPARAIIYLQRAVGTTPDGKIGPVTLAATNNRAPVGLIRAYQAARRDYYRSLRTFNTFGRGWLSRTDDVERVALSWVK